MRHKGHRNRFLCRTQKQISVSDTEQISVSKNTGPCTKTNKTSMCVKQNLIDLSETVDGEFTTQLFGH
jgi:hypothetical protein